MDAERVLIVGGGIAGLALAGLLRRAGRACEIVERAERWAPVGAGIGLGVNAMGVLRRLDIAEALAARGHVLRELAITDARGRVLARSDLARLEARFGPSLAVHRAVLHDALLRAAGELPVRLGCTVDTLEPHGEGLRARFSDGSAGDYGLVVGADGLRSRVRELLFGPVPLRYAGYTCWRLVADAPPGASRAQEMWGVGRRFGVVPIGGGRVYCFAVANAPADAPDPEEGRLERFRARFREFAGPVPSILGQLEDPQALIHNDLCEVVHRPWHRGAAVLVGDAAHALTPNMGQGAAMALEDVAVLAEELALRRPLGASLEAWMRRRAGRVRWVQDQSRRIGRVAQWQSLLACRLRNGLLRRVPDAAHARALERLVSQPI